MTQTNVKADTLILLFDSDKFELTDKAQINLYQFTLRNPFHEQDSIFITGHTDFTGNLEYNKELSLKRAEAVKSFLLSKGIKSPFICAARASFQPLTSDTSAIGKQRNRRVEVIVKYHQVVWKQKVQVFPMTNDGWYSITTKNGCILRIEPNSVKIAPTDSVFIRITEYNNEAEYVANRIPMSYQFGNNIMMFDSEQMMKIEAFSKDKRELELYKLFELDCPFVDTTDGVKFYQLREQEQKIENLEFEFEYGNVIRKEKPEIEDVENDWVPEFEQKEVEKSIPPKRAKMGGGAKNKSGKSGKSGGFSFGGGRKPKPSAENPIVVIIDTTSFWEVIAISIDTLSGINSAIDRDCGPLRDVYFSSYYICYAKQNILATLEKVKLLLAKGVLSDFKDLDFNTYCERYKRLDYVRDKLKSELTEDEIYNGAPQWIIRKRFLRKQLIFKLKEFPENIEYSQLRKVKWVSYYGENNFNKETLLQLNGKVIDFRVIDIYPNYFYGKEEYDFGLEFKTEQGFYSVRVAPTKKYKEVQSLVRRYEYVLAEKEVVFNRKVEEQLNISEISPVLRVFHLLNFAVNSRAYECRTRDFTGPLNLPMEMRQKLQPVYDNSISDFSIYQDISHQSNYLSGLNDWFHSVDYNKAQLISQIDFLAQNLDTIQKLICMNKFCPPDTIAVKWEYAGGNNGNGRIIRVGLGMYNFDRIHFFAAKQIITNPILVDEWRNIILNKEDWRDMQVYSVIPGIKGLLWHSKTSKITLISGKVNVLYFHNKKTDKMYKAIYDLRNEQKVESNSIVVKDITVQGKTIKGLKEELERVEW